MRPPWARGRANFGTLSHVVDLEGRDPAVFRAVVQALEDARAVLAHASTADPALRGDALVDALVRAI